jgi:hypothetical protein
MTGCGESIAVLCYDTVSPASRILESRFAFWRAAGIWEPTPFRKVVAFDEFLNRKRFDGRSPSW